MSRVYFHTPTEEAELRGSERAWLAHVAAGPGTYAWDLDRSDHERAYALVAMSPEPEPGRYGANYLHAHMREAQEADRQYREACKRYADAGRPDGPLGGPRYNPKPSERFLSSLRLSLRVQGFDLEVAGHRLTTANVELNTALVAGSRPVQLAAKIHGWCEVHCWVEGPDRAWLAEIIAEGLAAGIYRRGLWYADRPDAPRDKWSSQGWEEVTALLERRDDEPVVMSYSVCESFPNQFIGGWMPPWPDGVPERYDALTDEQKLERDDRQDAFYELDGAEQWRIAMDALREVRPWARLAPDTLASVSFGPMVTVYDLFAPDRDERIARAFADDPAAQQRERSEPS